VDKNSKTGKLNMRTHKILKGKRGFTLVEVIVVAVIVGILAMIGIPYYVNQLKSERCTAVMRWVEGTAAAAAHHEVQYGDGTATFKNTHTRPPRTVIAWSSVTESSTLQGLKDTKIVADADKCIAGCGPFVLEW
jgi:prepilin-type N-terminal cleavage/methylation domain-containing protein